jgi:Mo-co oxidoreductase dimerisation domain
MVPINAMVPRSFITSLKDGDALRAGHQTVVRGVAFGGDTGVAKVMFSPDGGSTWQDSRLGKNHGKYSLRRFEADFTPAKAGAATLMVKAINTHGAAQPLKANWNPGGYLRNIVEQVQIRVS